MWLKHSRGERGEMLGNFQITLRGKSHIETDTPCQDYSFSQKETINGKELVIAAISDGVGSCEYSQFGSEMAVRCAIEYVSDHLKELEMLEDDLIKEVIKNSFNEALRKIEKKASDMEIPFLEFDCTLTLAVYDGKKVIYGHSGDGGIVALYNDAGYGMMTRRHKGELANSVFPLRETDEWEFGIKDNISSFLMMTDGVLDACVDSAEHNERVLWPFIEPVLTEVIEDKKKLNKVRDDWHKIFRNPPKCIEHIVNRIFDDITFLAVTNSDAVKATPSSVFDWDKWDEETEEFNRKAEEILFSKFIEYSNKLKASSAEKEEIITPKKKAKRHKKLSIKKGEG